MNIINLNDFLSKFTILHVDTNEPNKIYNPHGLFALLNKDISKFIEDVDVSNIPNDLKN